MKVKIVERVAPDGCKTYVIKQRHFLFPWRWCDAWVNSTAGASCQDSFPTLEEAQKNLCWFDGTTSIERVMPNTPQSVKGEA